MTYKLLVADDDNTICYAAETFFTGKGFTVISAVNGEEALEKIISEKPDVILLDIEMPKLSGFEVLTKLQNDPSLMNIPVMIITGDAREIEKSFDYGAYDCFLKPVKWGELGESVKGALG